MKRNKCRIMMTAALLAAPMIAPGAARAQFTSPAPSLHTPGPGDPAWITRLRAGFQNNRYDVGFNSGINAGVFRGYGFQPGASAITGGTSVGIVPNAFVQNQPGMGFTGGLTNRGLINGFDSSIVRTPIGGVAGTVPIPGFVPQPPANLLTPSMLAAPAIPQVVPPEAIGNGPNGIATGFYDRFGNTSGFNRGFNTGNAFGTGFGTGFNGGFGTGFNGGSTFGTSGVGGPTTFGR